MDTIVQNVALAAKKLEKIEIFVSPYPRGDYPEEPLATLIRCAREARRAFDALDGRAFEEAVYGAFYAQQVLSDPPAIILAVD